MPDIHSETAPSRAWRRFQETSAGVGGGAFVLLLGAAASAGSTWLSEGHSLKVRVLIAFGFGLIGAVAAGASWYLALLVAAPYGQRDAAREELFDAAALEALLGAIADRLRLGVELKKFAEQMAMGEYESVFKPDFDAWDSGNVVLLKRLTPGFVGDYKFAEEPPELFETRTTGAFTDRYLPAAGQVEVKLRSLRAIRDQLRAEH